MVKELKQLLADSVAIFVKPPRFADATPSPRVDVVITSPMSAACVPSTSTAKNISLVDVYFYPKLVSLQRTRLRSLMCLQVQRCQKLLEMWEVK